MKELRRRIRAIVLIITGALMGLLALRFMLILFSANQSHPLVNFLFAITGPLVTPFEGLQEAIPLVAFDIATIVAMVVVVVWGIMISEIITAFLYDDPKDIILNVINVTFKLIEFFLASRIVLKLLGIPGDSSSFVGTVYYVTDWASGFLPSIIIWRGVLEISIIVSLVVVAIVDVTTDSLMRTILEDWFKKPATPAPSVVTPVVTPVAVQAPQAAPQNITINMPVQRQAVPVPVAMPPRQVINVPVPPQQRPAALPGPRQGQ